MICFETQAWVHSKYNEIFRDGSSNFSEGFPNAAGARILGGSGGMLPWNPGACSGACSQGVRGHARK